MVVEMKLLKIRIKKSPFGYKFFKDEDFVSSFSVRHNDIFVTGKSGVFYNLCGFPAFYNIEHKKEKFVFLLIDNNQDLNDLKRKILTGIKNENNKLCINHKRQTDD